MYARLGESEEEVRKAKRRRMALKEEVKAATQERDDAVSHKEALAKKVEEAEGNLGAARAAMEELVKEKEALSLEKAQLEREKAEMAEAHLIDAARLRSSRIHEVTRERARVVAAMTAKAQRRFDYINEWLDLCDPYDEARCNYSQAFGTRRCLEVMKKSGDPISQERIDLFREREQKFAAEARRLCPRDFTKDDLSLSPLVLESYFVDKTFLASLETKYREDPFADINHYGSNDRLIDPDTVASLRTSSPSRGEQSVGNVVNKSGECSKSVTGKEAETVTVASSGSSENEDDDLSGLGESGDRDRVDSDKARPEGEATGESLGADSQIPLVAQPQDQEEAVLEKEAAADASTRTLT